MYTFSLLQRIKMLVILKRKCNRTKKNLLLYRSFIANLLTTAMKQNCRDRLNSLFQFVLFRFAGHERASKRPYVTAG